MTQARRERPLLATLICIYDGIFVMWYFAAKCTVLLVAHTLLLYDRVHPLQTALECLMYAITGTAVIALWQMRRAAVLLYGSRIGLWLILLTMRFPVIAANNRRISTAISHSMVFYIIYSVIVAGWIIRVLIVWYIYKITSPKASLLTNSGPELIA